MNMADSATTTELLASLAAREQALYSYTISLVGTLESKNQHLEEAGVFAAYDELYAQYLAACQRAAEGPLKLELLKRLAFLSWYSLLEPSFLTGIGALTTEDIFATYELLDAYLRDQQPDHELHWMLSFYSSWDYLLLHFAEPRLPTLTAFVKAVDSTVYHVPERQLPPHAMDNRGQMGIYWQSMRVEVE
jgi:hypothetical protein